MTGGGFSHIPVMPEQVLDGLAVFPGGLYVDGTLGGGGHAAEMIARGGRVIGIDRDEAALAAARERLGPGLLAAVHDNYANITDILKTLIIEKIDGALLDLGVSSYQLDTPERGFSYHHDAPLDMRMNQKDLLTAKTVVNGFAPERLEKILLEYAEERYARLIVRKLVAARSVRPIETTLELAELVKSAVPPKVRRAPKHPAKKTFQAIRIAVNDELSGLHDTMKDFCAALKPGGRLAVITFHSLEDRIVKNAFAQLCTGCICPKEFPICVCGKTPEAKPVTRKPMVADAVELAQNRRSASAKLRVIEKLERG